MGIDLKVISTTKAKSILKVQRANATTHFLTKKDVVLTASLAFSHDDNKQQQTSKNQYFRKKLPSTCRFKKFNFFIKYATMSFYIFFKFRED